MNPAQTATLFAGLALAALCVRWAMVEVRRETRLSRFALISGPYGGGTFSIVLLAVVLLVPLLYVVFAFELVPKGAPWLFAVTLGWICVAWIAAIFAGVAIQIRRNALGWLTLVGSDQLQVDADGSTMVLKLGPGAVRLYPVDGAPQFAQFVITDGSQITTVWGMISIRGMKDVTNDAPMKPHGLMLAGSAEPFRRWLAPFVVTN